MSEICVMRIYVCNIKNDYGYTAPYVAGRLRS